MFETLSALCITIDPTNEERAGKAIKEIQALGFREVTFLMGVKGKELSEREIRDLLTPRSYFELRKGRYVHEALSGLGSVGCFLSHVEAWKHCRTMNQPLVIFEDDFIRVPDGRKKMEEALQEAELLDYDILRFQHVHNADIGEELEETSSPLLYKVIRTQGATAYIITPRAAEILLDGFESYPKIDLHVDHYLDMASLYYNLRQYCSKESLSFDPAAESHIGHNTLKMYNDGLGYNTLKRHRYCIVLFILIALICLYFYTSEMYRCRPGK